MILIQHAEFNYKQEQATLIQNQILKVLMGKGKPTKLLKRYLKDLSEENLMLLLTSPLLKPFRIPDPVVDTAKQLVLEHLESSKKKLS